MLMIEAQGLARRFDTKQGPVDAVRGLDFQIEKGEVVGFLGPNGAGKTTTMRMLTTLLPPTSGHATVAGRDLLRDPQGVRLEIGLVAQTGGTRPTATVMDELLLQAMLYRMPKAMAKTRAEELTATLDLTGLENRTTITLSGGQRRRLDVALGLVHRPQVIFLDEPTAALDPASRISLWQLVRQLRDEYGTTVFLSTHHLEEADTLCDRILILDKGKILAEDSPTHLKQVLGNDVIVIEIDGDVEAAYVVLAAQPDGRSIAVDGSTVRISCENGDKLLMQFLLTLHNENIKVRSTQIERPTLDDVFMSITGRAEEEESVASHGAGF
jgi:ABC-2 type transport system ATP-binding protein